MSIVDYRFLDAPSERRTVGTGRANEYHRAVESLAPALRRILGPAVGADDQRVWRSGARASRGAERQMMELAAAQAIALCLRGTEPPEAGVRDQIRSALLRWQLSLLGDGRPAHSAHRDMAYRAGCANYVARILAGGNAFETPVIVTDLARHIRWLWRGGHVACWSEAALIDGACEAALVAREGEFLRRARERLRGLLSRQHEEGWFGDSQECSLVGHACLVDSLARVSAQTGWPELEDPLRRAMGFAAQFLAAPRGDLFPLSAIPFYAAEALGADVREAGRVAAAGRSAAMQGRDLFGMGDERMDMALAASSMSLAAGVAAPVTRAAPALCRNPISRSAGFLVRRSKRYEAWVDVRNGGALAARWHETGASFEDDLSVIGHRGVARSEREADDVDSHAGDTVFYRGGLRRRVRSILGEGHGRAGVLQRLRSAMRYGTHEREIIFESDQLVIRDRIALRRRADAVVFGSINAAESTSQPIVLGGVKAVELIRVYREGELVELRRDTK